MPWTSDGFVWPAEDAEYRAAVELAEEYEAAGIEQRFWADLANAQGGAIELAGTDTASLDELMAAGGYGDDFGGQLDDLSATHALIEATQDLEQRRLLEDEEDRLAAMTGGLRTSEQKLQRGLARLATGSYVPQGEYARNDDDPDDLSGRYSPVNCGVSDYFGRCAAAVHETSCSHNLGNPSGLDVHEVEAWRAAMNKNRTRPAGLDAELYEPAAVQGRDACVHSMAVALGIAGNGTSPEGRTHGGRAGAGRPGAGAGPAVVSGGHGEAGLPDFETLTGTGPQHSSQQVTDEIKRSLGIGPRRVRYDGPQAADDGLIMEEGPWDD